MISVQQQRLLPVSVEQRPRTMTQSLPSLAKLQEGTARGRYSSDSKLGTTSTDRTAAPGLRTPPMEMDVNPLLASNHGPLQYKGVPVVASNNSNYPTSQGSIGHTTYTSRAQPVRESYYPTHRSHNSTSGEEPAGSRAQVPRRRNSEGSDIVHYLQIPRSINDSKGSLAEFAAQITCLFWFESSGTLKLVEESREGLEPFEPLLAEAMPSSGFRKWVTTILSTTQVTQNVILLALMFIHRLKRLNPGVKGKLGSEYRLLTVALMLGNKFLDDNTYTNKTWAEVSGISVQEIHIMEVEFLSNMRYTLYVSDKEWEAWHIKLGLFWSYFAKASKKPMEIESRRQGIEAPPNLNFSSNSSNLPSPPGSNHTSPPYSTSQSFGHTALPHPLSIPPYLPPSAPSPLSQLPAVDARFSARKRSRDEDSYEPPPKRPALPSSISSSATVTPSTIRGSNPPAPRLPMPNLSISTSGQSNSYNYSHGTQLPAPNRSSNGQTPGSSRWPQSNQLPSLPQPSPFPPSSANFPGNADWQNRQSPYGAGSATPSPTSYHFPQSQHTPTHLSPSGYPIPRHSPYKPVRSVNTLLVPPPSASLHDPPQNLGYDQMHYQPLGKPGERRSGTLPYVHPEEWSQTTPNQPFFLPQPAPYSIPHQGPPQSRVR